MLANLAAKAALTLQVNEAGLEYVELEQFLVAVTVPIATVLVEVTVTVEAVQLPVAWQLEPVTTALVKVVVAVMVLVLAAGQVGPLATTVVAMMETGDAEHEPPLPPFPPWPAPPVGLT